MRKNIFLHFLNRDSREIFGLYRFHSGSDHIALLKGALNVSILLCEEHCVIPPGFAIEDELAFELFEVNQAFLSNRFILLPMRESNLTEYAEKKRIEYSPQRDRYSGLFSDRRLEFLGTKAVGLVPRKSKIAEEIVSGWEGAADRSGRLWTETKRSVAPAAIELVRKIPSLITDVGAAVTWAEISTRLPHEARGVSRELRNSLQHIYFSQYCREFHLAVMCELPFARDDFSLPTERAIYSYTRFADFLAVFSLQRLFVSCSAATLCTIKRKSGLIEFVDAYHGIAKLAASRADLLLRAERARKASRFDWAAFAVRHELLLGALDGLAIAELDDALSEIAHILTDQNGIPRRIDGKVKTLKREPKSWRIQVTSLPEVLLYVALQEELDVLVKHFGLASNARNPVATGELGGVRIGVISARAMGRVPAAVEVARYLESRRDKKPRLIVVVGLAGGFREEGTKEGHILCASTVVDLASRKVQDADETVKTRFRRKDFNLDDSLSVVLQSDAFKKEAWISAAIEAGDWPQDRRPSLHFGPVASVDEVVASDEWKNKLRESTEKLLGVEMEAGGVCAAAYAYGVPVAMLRAVSDNADPAKADDAWRKRGMKTIAKLLEMVQLREVFKAMER
jgi:nucleoside phosphorylase